MHVNPYVEFVLLRSAILFLAVGSLAGLVTGAMLFWHSNRLRMAGVILNRWVSTRHLNQALDRTVEIDPWFYRHRRISGGLILLGALYILYTFTVGLDRISVVTQLSGRFGMSSGMVEGFLDALVLSALLGALLAAFVSLFLLMRPSWLKDFEQTSNRWMSLRRALKPMEVRRDGVDEYVFRHGRGAGILLMLGSLYVLALLTTWIGH